MILNWSYQRCGYEFSIIDAESGECLDREGIRFADSVNGLYYRCLRNERGNRYTVKDPVHGTDDVAVELVYRKIRFVPLISDTSCP